MTGNLQKKEGFVSGHINILEFAKLTLLFAVKKINLQQVLYFSAFLTFGMGDGITAAYMMDMRGIGTEANPIARYLFMSQGFGGIVVAKMWFTLLIILLIYIIQLKSSGKMYWTTNGFLVALTAGGLLAMNANLTVLAGEAHQPAGEIIFAYLLFVLILTEIGSFADKRLL